MEVRSAQADGYTQPKCHPAGSQHNKVVAISRGPAGSSVPWRQPGDKVGGTVEPGGGPWPWLVDGLSPSDQEPRHGALAGPWDCGFYMEVPFEVRSKSNARRYRRAPARRRESWQAYASFEKAVAALAMLYKPAGWDLGPPPPAAVSKRPAVVGFIFAYSPLDATNLPKSLLDALQGTLYWSDASVGACFTAGERTRSSQGAALAFAQIGPGATTEDMLLVGSALTREMLAMGTGQPKST